MEKDTEKRIEEVKTEELEEANGGSSPLIGPFCIACGRALTFANGSYKCFHAGCTMQGEPQEGFYKHGI